MIRDFELVAVTAPVLQDPSIAIAASRAGGLGVLDLSYSSNVDSARAAIARLVRYATGQCGIKLDGEDREFVDRMDSELPEAIEIVILAPGEPQRLGEQVQALQRRDLAVWLECTSLNQARLGEEVGVNGLIAKGHEASGWVDEETTFILVQRFLSHLSLPVWAQGGIGLHTAAACYAAGAAGVVLDSQLALTRESPLPDEVKEAVARMDGSETVCLGTELDQRYRVYTRPGLHGVEALSGLAESLARDDRPHPEVVQEWRQAVKARVGWTSMAKVGKMEKPRPETDYSQADLVWPLGQDAAFAAPLAEQFNSVGGILSAVRDAANDHLRDTTAIRPLAQGGPMARSHRTRYPIVQGPMTRVSDRAEFALQVAEGGGLPFLALALMRAPQVDTLLRETQELLGDRSWGVGILGFVPLDLRQEQLEVISTYRPPFALIAGGRPDQARTLEEQGIATYLHVPSPGLLRMFLEDGARRFVFEGRECGGHVGPRTSFVLWNTMIDVLLENLPEDDAENCHVLFAGGIHDSVSASMVSTMAAPLAERGVRVGVLLGTSYLFTEEAVTSGAILPGFQEEAVDCNHTVLLETGPGHLIRCVENTYAEVFERKKRCLKEEGKAPEEIRETLEAMNVGRLRVASKGIDRHPRYGEDPDVPKYVQVSEEEQHEQGMYMIGQLAALREGTCTIGELHREIAVGSSQRLEERAQNGGVDGLEYARDTEASRPAVAPLVAADPSEIAIVGMSAVLPKAKDLQTYWENVLNEVNAITEVPQDRWNPELYYDPDRDAKDKVYSKWGGFIDDVPFDPLEYGMPPKSLPSIEPMQLLALEAARRALEDAGYWERPFDRSRTSTILGASGGVADLGAAYVLRSGLPLLFGEAAEDVVAGAEHLLPEWTEDSFAGLLLNVAAGRITNRLDFGGLNYIVDAACASSLTAVHLAVKELETHNTDMVIAGGVDTVQNPFAFLCFSKTQALSPTGQPRTFDASADGIAISEGIVMLVLKRLTDAERDGDRIYAVIQGVGGSSDGKAMGLTAPRPEGQRLALQRAYAKAGISPTTVGLFEAHGTGTVVGDRTEARSLTMFLENAGAGRESHALGSVKSMIGHTKATAGVAGLAKVALALYHKVLPPTLGVTEPNPEARFGEGPLYINSEARPWIQGVQDHPRRAGVSAFGFGGTNFHAVVEEYTGEFLPRPASLQRWPSELFLWSADSRQELRDSLSSLEGALARGAQPELRNFSYSLYQTTMDHRQSIADGVHLAIVAGSLDDLQQKLTQAREALDAEGPVHIQDPRGIFFTDNPLAASGKVAFLFPGQGSQAPNMFRDLALQFSEVRKAFERADGILADKLPQPLSRYVFPPPAFSPEDERAQQEVIKQTDVAQPALGAAEVALFRFLEELGVAPDLVGGHSYGEYVALYAAGVFDERTLITVSEARGRCIVEAARDDLGTMAAVSATPERVDEVLDGLEDVWIANLNAPAQTIVSGSQVGVEQAVARLQSQEIRARTIPVACAFHSPIVAPAQERLTQILSTLEFSAPQVDVFSNTTAARYPVNSDDVRELLAEHLIKPVRFVDEIEAMYAAGARMFIEVGPRNVLTGLVERTLSGRPHAALAVDAPGGHGLTRLLRALGQLAVQGVPLVLDRLFQDRDVRQLDLDRLEEETGQQPLSPTTWLVNGGRAKPLIEALQPDARRARDDGRAWTEAPRGQTAGRGDGGQGASEEGAAPAKVEPPRPEMRASHPSDVSVSARGDEDARIGSRSEDASTQPPTPSVQEPASYADDEAGQVMLQFQQLMSRFLDTQREVMSAYLRDAQDVAAGGDERPSVADEAQPMREVAPPSSEHRRSRMAREELGDRRGSKLPADLSEPPPVPEKERVERGRAAATEAPAVETMVDELPDREQLIEHLLEIVSDRTGYPAEMLELDVDIEADLGIDSIKRVEILGAFQREHIPPDHRVGDEAMEELTGIKTLGGVVDWIDDAIRPDSDGEMDGKKVSDDGVRPPPVQQSEAPPSHEGVDGHRIEVSRFTLSLVDAPLAGGNPPSLSADKVFLITDGGCGVAEVLSGRIADLGGRAVLVRMGGAVSEIQPGVYEANVTDPESAAEVVARVRQQQGQIGGIVHLLPLSRGAAFEEIGFDAWHARLAREVKGLFHLTKAAVADLKPAGENGTAFVVAATAMGGTFGLGRSVNGLFFPGQAGIAGYLKTLALEWPGVRCKAIDLDTGNSDARLVEQLLQEMGATDGEVEVGYRGSRRLVPQLSPGPLDQTETRQLAISDESVVLVTGGACGITAEVACELAERYRPTLLLLGRSPLPPTEESAQTAGITSSQELKVALMDQMRQVGEQVTVPRVEAAYERLLKDREMRENLAAMRAAGATVRYFQADVRNEERMAELIERLYQEYGRLDGVIHGAGVIEDKLIEDKTPASFHRVFDTKADSAFILSRLLRSDSLKFLVLFSSAAGHFGNRGQSDYAATNEVMNKLAIYLDGRWPGRVVSINWGPWAKRGMVSDELQREFAKRGIELIPVPVGRRMLDRELHYGMKGEAEVIIASGKWGETAPGEDASSEAKKVVTEREQPPSDRAINQRDGHGRTMTALPFLDGARSSSRGGSIEVIRTLDPSHDLYLRDHRLDGKPVLPVAMAIELMVEVAQQGWPDLTVLGLRDLKVLRGVVLDDGPKSVRVVARAQAEPPHDRLGVNVSVEIQVAERSAPPYYRTTVELGDGFPEPPQRELLSTNGLGPFLMDVDEAYREWLFHGPTFQGLTQIHGISEQGMVATCRPSSPRECLAGNVGDQWLIDPVVFDSGLQLIILWARKYHAITPLPAGCRGYRRFASLAGGEIRCYLRASATRDGHTVHGDLSFVGSDGRLLGMLEDLECTGSRTLNRLAGGHLRE